MSIPGAKVIKSLGTKRFEVELYQLDSGKFCVKSSKSIDPESEANYTEAINDLTTATIIFDTLVRQFEGH